MSIFSNCIVCGGDKVHPFDRCSACGFEPQTEDERIKSMLLSSVHYEADRLDELSRVAERVRTTGLPTFDDADYERMRDVLKSISKPDSVRESIISVVAVLLTLAPVILLAIAISLFFFWR